MSNEEIVESVGAPFHEVGPKAAIPYGLVDWLVLVLLLLTLICVGALLKLARVAKHRRMPLDHWLIAIYVVHAFMIVTVLIIVWMRFNQ